MEDEDDESRHDSRARGRDGNFYEFYYTFEIVPYASLRFDRLENRFYSSLINRAHGTHARVRARKVNPVGLRGERDRDGV